MKSKIRDWIESNITSNLQQRQVNDVSEHYIEYVYHKLVLTEKIY